MAPTRRVIALLRGINVGGNRRVPMADLRTGLTAAGAGAVATHLNSGNVAFDTALAAGDAATLVADAVATSSGVPDVDVVVRERAEIDRLIEDCPYPVGDPKKVHVAFLADGADAEALAAVDPALAIPEEFTLSANHVYLWLPAGVGRAKLGNDFWQRTAGVPSTMRNWATVTALRTL
jgi:uncharacterized protein (DUF1697 family)